MNHQRPDFCAVAGAAMFAAQLSGCGDAGPPADGGSEPDDLAGAPGDLASACSGSLVDAGPAAAVPLDGVVQSDCGHLFVCRDGQGLYAVTSICPHQGCDVEFDTSGFTCPCHLSAFDYNGALLMGPATRPLAHLLLTVDAGGIVTVDTSKKASAATRTQG